MISQCLKQALLVVGQWLIGYPPDCHLSGYVIVLLRSSAGLSDDVLMSIVLRRTIIMTIDIFRCQIKNSCLVRDQLFCQKICHNSVQRFLHLKPLNFNSSPSLFASRFQSRTSARSRSTKVRAYAVDYARLTGIRDGYLIYQILTRTSASVTTLPPSA